MAEEQKEKLVYVVTKADENPESATIPFVLATTTQAMDAEAIVVLQMTGVYLALKGYAEHVHAAGLPPLQELLDAFLAEGGKLFVCSPCIQSRKIDPADLIEGSTVVAGGTLADAFLEAKNVMVY